MKITIYLTIRVKRITICSEYANLMEFEMIDLRKKKTQKTITTVLVVILALAMVVPTLIWAIQGI